MGVTTWRRAFAGWLCVGLWTCTIYNEALLHDDGAGGFGSCASPSDCPGEDSDCSTRRCEEGKCSRHNAPAGTACQERGGQVCDGEQSCVECLGEEHCGSGQRCAPDNLCRDEMADDGAPCVGADACESGHCVEMTCCESSCAGLCRSCANARGECLFAADGTDPRNECGRDVCNGAGTCRCSDGMLSAGETDVDCGGPVCTPCENGKSCQGGGDCQSGICASNVCTTLCTTSAVVISQIYGGGGNSNSIYKNDFVELYNRGSTAVSISGWSLQYASAMGSAWGFQTTMLSGAIAPGAFYLVQFEGGSGGSQDLPAPDAVGATNLSATAGKLALVQDAEALSGNCPTSGSIVDFVGYGSTDCYEGSGPAPGPSNVNSVARAGSGCIDSDDNSADFATQPAYPNARNSTSPALVCCASG